jgi:hypothetical protein
MASAHYQKAFWQVWELKEDVFRALHWKWIGWLWSGPCDAKALQDASQRARLVVISPAGGNRYSDSLSAVTAPTMGCDGLSGGTISDDPFGVRWWSIGDRHYADAGQSAFLYANGCAAQRVADGTEMNTGVAYYPKETGGTYYGNEKRTIWLDSYRPSACG